MIRTLEQHWWVLLLRGIVAILFGLLAFTRPGLTIAALVLFFGAYALVDGIFEFIAGVRAKYGMLIFLGILGVAAGLITFFWPAITAITLLYVIAFWAIVVGILQIVAAFRLRKEVEGEWLWILSGLCFVALGFLLISRPGPGALSLVWLIGSFAMAWGILLVILAFRLKSHFGKLIAKPA
ncbi:MAG TPA: HdeD family acid-resistance protein [Thermoanaerobaculia bacterium]|nr:HdeD family acid-resistance protein [Thermoanaerobaculia bacterium]